jgi:hypothetical protein
MIDNTPMTNRKALLLGISDLEKIPAGTNNRLLNHLIGGNSGNLLFVHALRKLTDASPSAVPWDKPFSNEDICFVMPLANQLNSGFNMGSLADIYSSMQHPVVGIGLGAQSASLTDNPSKVAAGIPAGTKKWLQVMTEKAPSHYPSLGMRGQFSLEVAQSVYSSDSYIVTGCPSNFINPTNALGSLIRASLAKPLNRIAVAAGAPHFGLTKLEACLCKMVQDMNGTYVTQHPVDLIVLGDSNFDHSIPYAQQVAAYCQIGSSADDAIAWMKRYSCFFVNVDEWVDSMKQYDLVVGMRIHGVMAGLQAGIPGLCLCIDSRTQELCETMYIPWVKAHDYKQGITTDEIVSKLKSWDWDRYDSVRRCLCQTMVTFFEKNFINHSTLLEKILAA